MLYNKNNNINEDYFLESVLKIMNWIKHSFNVNNEYR